MRRRLLCLLVWLLCQPARALDDEPWQAPAGCPSAADVLDREQAHPAAVQALRAGRVTVRIDRAPTGELRARLRIAHDTDDVESRELRAADCAALSEGVLLVLDMASVGDVVATDVPEPVEEAAPEPVEEAAAPAPPPARADIDETTELPPSTVDAPPARVQPATTPEPRPPASLGSLALLQLDAGSLAAPTLGVSAGGVWTRGRAWLDARATYLIPREVRLADQPEVGVDTDLIAATVRGCFLGRHGPRLRARPRVGACLAADLGAARGRAVGLEVPRDGGGAAFTLLFGALLTLGPFGSVLPFAQLELGPVLASPAFAISDVPVHHADGWVVRLSLGSAWLAVLSR